MSFFKDKELPNKCDNLIELPDEILLGIFVYLTTKDLLNLALTHSKLKKVAHDDSLWKIKLAKQFQINIHNKCKDIYKLLTLYENHKKFSGDKKTFLKQLKNSLITLLSLQAPFGFAMIQAQPEAYSFFKSAIDLASINPYRELINNTKKALLPNRILSDMKDMVNIISEVQNSLPQEKASQILSLSREFLKEFTQEFNAEKLQILLAKPEAKRKVNPNFYDRIFSKLEAIASYIKTEYLTSYYTPPTLLVVFLASLPFYTSSDISMSSHFIFTLVNYVVLMQSAKTVHHLFSNTRSRFQKELESKDAQELKVIFENLLSTNNTLS